MRWLRGVVLVALVLAGTVGVSGGVGAQIMVPIPGGGGPGAPPPPPGCDATWTSLDITWANGWWFYPDYWEGSFKGRGECASPGSRMIIGVELKAIGGTTDTGSNACTIRVLSCHAKTRDDPRARVLHRDNQQHCFEGEVGGWFATGQPDVAPWNNWRLKCV